MASIQVELQGRHDLKRFETSGQFASGAQRNAGRNFGGMGCKRNRDIRRAVRKQTCLQRIAAAVVLVLAVVVEVAVAVGKIGRKEIGEELML